MTTLFLICAIVGGTLFVCQLALVALGIGGGHDIAIDHDHDFSHAGGSAFWGILSFRAMVAALTVFGLTGMATSTAKMAMPIASGVALGCALVTLFFVGFLMRSLTKMTADGTANIENARGATGTVYVPIPGDRKGLGKIQIDIQDRTVELQAVTFNNALETGTKVVVVDVVSPDTVEVIAVPQMRTANV